ncbi:MAG: hypothetical protein CMK59_02535 [Proteobacteria bacterium]|nr:hypothetical protein [Pseudomonadota bacterium]
MGLINRVTPSGQSLEIAKDLAKQIASYPQKTMLGDRQSVYEQFDLNLSDAIQNELSIGLSSLDSKEYLFGARAFSQKNLDQQSQD